jgi:hypothetical protein
MIGQRMPTADMDSSVRDPLGGLLGDVSFFAALFSKFPVN